MPTFAVQSVIKNMSSSTRYRRVPISDPERHSPSSLVMPAPEGYYTPALVCGALQLLTTYVLYYIDSYQIYYQLRETNDYAVTAVIIGLLSGTVGVYVAIRRSKLPAALDIVLAVAAAIVMCHGIKSVARKSASNESTHPRDFINSKYNYDLHKVLIVKMFCYVFGLTTALIQATIGSVMMCCSSSDRGAKKTSIL